LKKGSRKSQREICAIRVLRGSTQKKRKNWRKINHQLKWEGGREGFRGRWTFGPTGGVLTTKQGKTATPAVEKNKKLEKGAGRL